MKEFVISEAQVETAVLVGLITKLRMSVRRTNTSTSWHSWLRQRGGSSEKIYSEVRPGKLRDIRRQG